MRTPDVAARNVVVMAGSTVRTVGERLGRCRGRARAPAGRQPRPGRSLPNATMSRSRRAPAARVAVAAPPRRRDYVPSPRRLASAGRLMGVVVTEATTPRRRAHRWRRPSPQRRPPWLATRPCPLCHPFLCPVRGPRHRLYRSGTSDCLTGKSGYARSYFA